jgi:uncharacterized protein (TIGR02594 family)
LREAGIVESRYGNQAAEQTRLAGKAIGTGIAEIGKEVGDIQDRAQQHTDTAAWLEGMKDGTANDLAAFDTIEGIGTKRTDADGNPSPSTPAFNAGTNDLLTNYQQTLDGEREKFAASGASQKEQDRFAMHQATRLHSVMVKAHSEAVAVSSQEALGNVEKASNTIAAQVDRHPETLDDAMGRMDDTVSAASGGMSRLEAKQTLGPAAVKAKGALITAGIVSYAKNGQLDQVDRVMNDPKYDQYIGDIREKIADKVSSVTAAHIRDQNAKDAAQDKAIGGQQDSLVDQVYRNSLLPPEQQDPKLARSALETSPLFAGRPTDLQKARTTLDQLQKSTIDPGVSDTIASGISRGITSGQITNPAQIDAAYDPTHPNKSITWQTRTRLQTELKDAIDNPATKEFHGAINDYLKRNEGQIDIGFAQGGPAARTDLGQQMVGKWETEVKRRAQIMRQQGKDPHDLLDPTSPESMVTPQALAPYRVTEQMNQQYQASRSALDKTIDVQRAAGQTPTGAVPVPKPLEAVPNLMRNKSTGQFYDPAAKQFYNADGNKAPMTFSAPTPPPPARKMNFEQEQPTGDPAQQAIDSAIKGPQKDALLSPETNRGGSPLDIATQYLGKNEYSNRHELAEFFRKAGGSYLDPAKTAWCARFVNSVLASAGIQGSGSDLARSFLNVGDKVDPKVASPGDVIVFARGSGGIYGHVGFIKSINPYRDEVTMISGNNRGAVRVDTRSLSDALGIRRIQQKHVGTTIPGVTDQSAAA